MTTNVTPRHLDLDALVLLKGVHDNPDDGLCLLEAAAFLAGEPHSDQPRCVSTVLGAFGRSLNDRLDDDRRQQLKPLLPALLGTAGDGLDEQRGYLALDWLVRTYASAWLGVAGLTAEATELRALHRIVDLTAAQAAGPIVRSSATKAQAAAAGACAFRGAARAAARAAANAAAWAAAGDVAGDAAWAPARDAASAAAWAGAGAAARAAAWAVAGDAASAAAWAVADPAASAAARAAAWAVSGDAAWAAWAAARAAALDALEPTVVTLQESAIDLFARMIRPARTASG